jgi:mannose-1-phosphate guanylyltransferase
MAGGQGTRFWPLSLEKRPKQFLNIVGDRSMLQQTVDRLEASVPLRDVCVVSGERYLDEIRRQLPELEEEQIIVEPAARNTAPAIGLAAVFLGRDTSEQLMAVLPSDHVIQKSEEFHQVLRAAKQLARENWLVTFGIQPSYPATGYGYLQQGESVGKYQGIETYRVARFVEKPNAKKAHRFLRQGGYFWNSGIFVWSIRAILAEIERTMPELYEGLIEIRDHWGDREEVARVFSRLERASIDFGVMEKAERVATIPCDLGWSDVGNWSSLRDILTKDNDGIVSNTVYEAVDSGDSLLFSQEGNKLVALVGVRDLIVVDTADALLVCSAERSEDVKRIVEELRRRESGKYL